MCIEECTDCGIVENSVICIICWRDHIEWSIMSFNVNRFKALSWLQLARTNVLFQSPLT